MKVYAHRGASSEQPENTLQAFQRALRHGVYGIELDVHLSKDLVPVVIHDTTVDRTTNGKGAVAELTLDQLQALDAGDGTRIPTLAETLDVVGARCHVDIEVKAKAAADSVIREAAQRPVLRWAMSSFDHDVLRYVRSMSRHVELWPLVSEFDSGAVMTARELGAPVLAIADRGVTREVVAELRSWEIGAWVWTVNDPDRARTLKSWSVEGVCTDTPGAIVAVVGGGQRADHPSAG